MLVFSELQALVAPIALSYIKNGLLKIDPCSRSFQHISIHHLFRALRTLFSFLGTNGTTLTICSIPRHQRSFWNTPSNTTLTLLGAFGTIPCSPGSNSASNSSNPRRLGVMLERATGCLENAGRRVLRNSNGAVQSRKSLSHHFWKDNGASVETPQWFLALLQASGQRSSPSLYTRPGDNEGGPSGNSGPLLDFLCPRETRRLVAPPATLTKEARAAEEKGPWGLFEILRLRLKPSTSSLRGSIYPPACTTKWRRAPGSSTYRTRTRTRKFGRAA